MQSSTGRLRFSRAYLLLSAVLLVALYLLVPQIKAFRSSWHLLLHPDSRWVMLAIGLTMLTYLAAGATYCLLAFKPLRYGSTVLVQFAAMFVNRLLPGGLGALGVNYAYLHRLKHSPTQAGSVVALNNLMGLLGHSLLLGLALVFAAHGTISPLPDHDRGLSLGIKLSITALLSIIVLFMIFRRHRLRRAIREILRNLLSYRQQPARLPAALLSSMLLTLSNVLCLSCCALALGVSLPFAAIVLIFTFGLSASTAIPTPGGLGGFEAGLTAGIVAYHVASPSALAIALLYRFVSYWLPLTAGAVALIISQRRHLLSF